VTDDAPPGIAVAADKVLVKAPSAAMAWLSSPRVAAARTATTVPTLSSLWTPPTALITPSPIVTTQAAPPAPAPTAPADLSDVVARVVNEVLNPFAGNGPTTPVDSPAEWMLLAAARRELGITATTYDPQIDLVNAVITGTNTGEMVSSRGYPLTYTVVGAPDQGGKVLLDPTTGDFTFLPYSTVVSSGGTEQFSVLVSETTPLVAALVQLPVVGSFVQPIVIQLYQVPIVSDILAPVIGYADVVTVVVPVGELAPGDTPVAFTTMVISFDGTPISVNYFPASGLEAGEVAPTILNGPGLATPGNIDPNSQTIVGGLVPGLAPLRDAGYNVVTWDPRGEFASGGVLQLDSPAFEGRDVSAIIDWVETQPATESDPTGDPLIGMVGGSYGGGIQLVTAGIDPRVDAIVPVIAWNSLNGSLYPNEAFKTSYASLLLLGLVQTGARINSQIYAGILTGALLGILTPSQQALLASSGPDFLLNDITAPTLFIQGTVDVLFPLQQAVDNAEVLDANGVPVKMMWVCGGHGFCLDPVNPEQTEIVIDATIDWLDKYVKGEDMVDTGPKFVFVDQNGQFYSSDLLPSDPAFYGDPIVVSGTGGILPIIPLLGGSGPQTLVPLPYSLGLGSEANNALDVPVEAPAGTQIVGAPELTLTYSGVGTSRHVYAQIVDEDTGLVVGNVVTPIPVTLDGQTHTVTVPLEDIAYTAPPDGGNLTLQIVGSATPYLNLISFGVINVSSVELTLPTADPAVVTPETSESELALVA
jgi:ABC-2 type transport system ATP-binding protein